MVNPTVAVMVASCLNANDAKHLNQMLPLGYRTADCQQVPTMTHSHTWRRIRILVQGRGSVENMGTVAICE